MTDTPGPSDESSTDARTGGPEGDPLAAAAAAGLPAPAELAAAMNASGRGALNERMDIRFVEASPELVVATMPVAGNTQPYGLLHGGASCVLAETVGSVAAALHGSARGRIAVGLDINATHHRAVRDGVVTGTARALRLGGSVASYEVVITDESGDRVCTARITCMLRSRPPQSPAADDDGASPDGQPPR